MKSTSRTKSEGIREQLNHPVIDSDGHTIEFQPAFLDFLKQVAGAEVMNRFLVAKVDRYSRTDEWYASTPSERAERRIVRLPWWGAPTKNTLDRATCILPKLLYERLDQLGLDFTVVYPTRGLTLTHIDDTEMRLAACRAYNNMQAETYAEFSDRMTPVAVIPMHTPQEALQELEHVVCTLKMKAVLLPSYVLRPRADGQGKWFDLFCLDSQYHYDPVWEKCIELRVSPTFHSGTMTLGTRTSISNYMFNHIGHFAASGEALCKAAFLGGVTRRFPQLRMGFLEGGSGWACTLYSDLIARWKKRNKKGLENYNPANLDRDLFFKLHREYGGKLVNGRLNDQRSRDLALYVGDPFLGPFDGDIGPIDDFEACGIKRPEDIRDLFVNNFYFGCEADDPSNAWSFDSKRNPYGAQIRSIFSSDIGHWDVPDITCVLEEAYELLEEGLITEDNLRDFLFTNPLQFWAGSNPDFFKGTVIDSQVASGATSRDTSVASLG